jgi:hypothetical protein
VHPRSPNLHALAERFAGATAGERANYALYLTELADALGVTRPAPAGGGFQFEYPVHLASRATGKETTNFADLYREGHFLLEAKDSGADGSNELLLRRAYAQAADYAGHVPPHPPPYVMVLDVGRVMLVWDRWSGTYGGFPLARRIDLQRLADTPDDIEFLRAAWESPASLDPNVRGRQVTREVAERLAKLSASLDERVGDPERVARFVMRCVFTMFAEDVDLLPGKPFQQAIEEFGGEPAEFAAAMEELWQAMDQGKRFGLRKLLRFNGHFFRDAEALQLTPGELAVLLDAAKANWRHVEPSIFGTLLTRALDPVERHRLGAEYTPREYVERVVRQAVDVPIRERWAPVQAEVLQLKERGRKKDKDAALARLREFHAWMRGLRFLDPACGSGNFLYVTLHTVKRIELEVLREIEGITGNPELGIEEVGPWQFHGIELKPWAREIAELTLWIGFHQFWMEHHKGVNPPEPVLQDTGTLEQRDAVLAWDDIVEDPSKSRPDPTPRIPHPVTGKLVPDPNARLPYYRYVNARQAEWPQADFIFGNPPYLGQARQREALGDGYVEALRAVYPMIPSTADLVMYWWYRAAGAVSGGTALRSGLITTNTITQAQNRVIISRASSEGATVIWAVADHPWVDTTDAAAVRVAMTVIARDTGVATLVEVDSNAVAIREVQTPRLNSDLTPAVDVASASSERLTANSGLAAMGMKLHGDGFLLSRAEATALLSYDPTHAEIIHPYWNGKDVVTRPRDVFAIDFEARTEPEAQKYPVLYDLVRTRVKPERDANPDKQRRERWWMFGRTNQMLRDGLHGLPRYIATAMTAKHRAFVFLNPEIVPDQGLVAIALDDAISLGVLNSSIHVVWALAAGGDLGGNTPRYNKSLCFDPFPFPDPPKPLREQIGLVAEALDQHRKGALARDERVTMTGMYNVVEKLRSGEALTPKERVVHEIAACHTLLDRHNELDALVAKAYGWPWPMEREEILERLVALHDERVEEEKRGVVRWLRPEYQIPRFAKGAVQQEAAELLPAEAAAEAPAAPAERRPWPAAAGEQITAVEQRVKQAPATADEVAAAFDGARADVVRHHLAFLVLVGQLREGEDGRFEPVAEPL